MLNVWPTILIVPIIPEALPSCFFSTELIMALELGEEKSENPSPIRTRVKIMNGRGVEPERKQSRIRPIEGSAMPAEASTPGLYLSESLPAAGERSAIVIGHDIRMNPASRGP